MSNLLMQVGFKIDERKTLASVIKGIRYSYRGGNDVANVKCYFREVKL